jgi:hypothetical protein
MAPAQCLSVTSRPALAPPPRFSALKSSGPSLSRTVRDLHFLTSPGPAQSWGSLFLSAARSAGPSLTGTRSSLWAAMAATSFLRASRVRREGSWAGMRKRMRYGTVPDACFRGRARSPPVSAFRKRCQAGREGGESWKGRGREREGKARKNASLCAGTIAGGRRGAAYGMWCRRPSAARTAVRSRRKRGAGPRGGALAVDPFAGVRYILGMRPFMPCLPSVPPAAFRLPVRRGRPGRDGGPARVRVPGGFECLSGSA